MKAEPRSDARAGIDLLQFIKTWREARRFLDNEDAWNGLVIYSEGASYGPYIYPIIDALGDIDDATMFYLTSDAQDPIYLNPPKHVKAYFIGNGSVRTFVFNKMRAKVVAMTMPDLETFHIKRSPDVQHYNYFHHSLVSTHMVYRKGAFDHFDSIMCVGPYHADEIRQWEQCNGLARKQVFEHGSPPVDALLEVAKKSQSAASKSKSEPISVLVAPSWGPHGVMETWGIDVISQLLDADYFVHLRPHPRTRQLAPKVIEDICETFEGNPNFEINENISGHEALLKSDVMISDWSGVAMEFSFGLGRPILFIDVPRKINNPDYTDISNVPVEVWYRDEVGVVLSPDQLENLSATVNTLVENARTIETKVETLRNELIHNIGSSSKRGAEILIEIKDGLENRP